MNTNQLRCFLATADKLSFTKAAQELYFSVPTITHHIQSLENELQTELFIRKKNGVALTENGRIFYPAALDIIRRYESAVHSISSNIQYDVLKIGCTSHAEVNQMTPVIKAFRGRFPEIVPFVDIDNYDMILDKFGDQQLNLVFTSGNMLKKRREPYTFSSLGNAVSCAVVASDHPLASKEEVSFDELSEMTLIGLHAALVPFGSENEVVKLMQMHHLKHRDILVEDDKMALTLAGAGYGIAILPTYCIPDYYQAIGLKCIPIRESQHMSYGIVSSKNEQREYVKHFIKLSEIVYKKRQIK